jgi:phage terminase Nu1 subunit (DNA packaging protein)
MPRAAVGFDDFAGEDEAAAAAAGFGGKAGDEQVFGLRQAPALVDDRDADVRGGDFERDVDRARLRYAVVMIRWPARNTMPMVREYP